jgi:hypothetical protein
MQRMRVADDSGALDALIFAGCFVQRFEASCRALDERGFE